MVHAFKSDYESLSVWRLLSERGRSPLVQIQGTLNQLKYIEIMNQYELPFKADYHCRITDFVNQHDGYRPHRAKRYLNFWKRSK